MREAVHKRCHFLIPGNKPITDAIAINVVTSSSKLIGAAQRACQGFHCKHQFTMTAHFKLFILAVLAFSCLSYGANINKDRAPVECPESADVQSVFLPL